MDWKIKSPLVTSDITAGVVNVSLPEIACLIASVSFAKSSVSFDAYKGAVVPPCAAKVV